MEQFHPFANLPKELRDCIWDMSIRDDHPTVHFFTIYDAQDDSGSTFDPTKKVHDTRDSVVLRFCIGFAAPQFRGSDRFSWTCGSLATYLTDSGLWTACYESRERMLRHFRSSETSPRVSQRVSQRVPVDRSAVRRAYDKPTALINMNLNRDNGERQYLTIRPSTDLIYLQRPNISWKSRYRWESINDFPLFRWHRYVRTLQSSHVMNIAVEYDPAWETIHPRKNCGPFQEVTNGFGKVDQIHGRVTFWFIDYRLRRKCEPNNRERQTFRAGNLAFIEVDSTDWEWCCCPEEGCLEGCPRGPGRYTLRGAHALVDELQSHIDSQPNAYHGFDRFRTKANCRVLACVDLQSEGKLPT